MQYRSIAQKFWESFVHIAQKKSRSRSSYGMGKSKTRLALGHKWPRPSRRFIYLNFINLNFQIYEIHFYEKGGFLGDRQHLICY